MHRVLITGLGTVNALGDTPTRTFAACLAREAKEDADERGAQVYADLAGYGLASDAAHIAEPSAEGQARAMSAALRGAGIAPADVAYINAHGTATVVGDRVESESIMRAFGAHAPAIPVSSTKALHGHVMGATGAIVTAVVSNSFAFGGTNTVQVARRADPRWARPPE